jgi:hypothetical protein
LLLTGPVSGECVIARRTNYNVERREREKTKAAESARKAQAKADKKVVGPVKPDED